MLETLEVPRGGSGEELLALGDCLEPLLHHNEIVLVDYARPARDGDLVVVYVVYGNVDLGAVRRSEVGVDWEQRFDAKLSRLAIKALLWCGGAFHLVCREGVRPLGQDLVLGVVTGVR